MYCQATGNGEVYACCPSTSNCRGSVEGNPVCADSAWSLWKGSYGNGFCCEIGLLGAFVNGGSVAGTCVTSVPATMSTAVLVTTGTATATTTVKTTSMTSTSLTVATVTTTSTVKSTSTSSSISQPTTTTGKPAFAHYMIGTITNDHCHQDIVDAQGLGIDAFALNFDQFASWSNTTVDNLFNNAEALGFKLFFSFDMSTGYFNDPNQYASYLMQYISRSSYYTYDEKPLVTTFGGGSVSTSQWNQFKSTVGSIVLIPAFYQTTPSSSFFSNNPALDGAFNWNSWASEGQGKIVVPTTDDETYLQAAKSAGKLFIMGISPLQFKHIDSGQNWYLRGEANLEYRLGQALSLQPDMLELQTWNDAGESHYMGNIWPEPISGSVIPDYTDGYDHTGYWQVLPSFIQAWKRGDTGTADMVPTNGAAAQGVFWHHTQLVSASCAPDQLGIGEPSGYQNAEDLVSGVILVAKGQTGLIVTVTSGASTLGQATLAEGFNKFSFSGLTTGAVSVRVAQGSSTVISGTGPISVSSSTSLCNFNFQVVGLA
ncbi:Glycoside hydrolase family 71 protein [Pleurostoma richardsiae]|uniref:Glycoside hydrolase family 71 protein n=1 Tax=Pleurostoma richardsiae TaxID=41990 RepID=A0AA38S7H6_9PEZI|nr:Glycoside hydrolase family 71 protein [Pleurostoma richardsiae]